MKNTNESETTICKFEDLSKACCVNCFNGLPTIGCHKHEEEDLHEMIHKKAERINKKHFAEGYAQAMDDFIEDIKPRLLWNCPEYTLAIRHCIEVAEARKGGSNDKFA